MKIFLHASMIVLFAATSVLGAHDKHKYVVVDFAGDADPYHRAAIRLAELRQGTIVPADRDNLGPLLYLLRACDPEYVAFVVRPEDFDENLARSVLQMATRVDSDPFVDFAYGFVTGASPEAAVALVEKPQRYEANRRQPESAVVAVGTKMVRRSGMHKQQFPLQTREIPQLWGQLAGGEHFAGEGRDAAFLKTLMPELRDKPMILFVGHGFPREVVGGPTWKDLQGAEWDGAVVINIACYTGVTGRWFEEDYSTGQIRQQTVPASESFCLNVLNTGAAAYVAFACVRPAGPELFMDISALAAEGLSVGEVRRRDYNRIVLAHLAQGSDKLAIRKVADGDRIRPRQNIVKDMLLDASTGGVLFGDPAFTPFDAMPKQSPLKLQTRKNGDTLAATFEVAGQNMVYFCGEQLDTWGEEQSPAMRVIGRIALGQNQVAEVKVAELKVGGKMPEHRLTWGIEEHRGERFLHVKAVFPPPTDPASIMAGVKAVFDITLTDDPLQAQQSHSSQRARS
jgi:hypothetical protein